MSLFTEWEVVNLASKVDVYSEMLSKTEQRYAVLEEQRDELLEALRQARRLLRKNSYDTTDIDAAIAKAEDAV